eukprot:4690820-Prorocentrum_lima.AAC.1
MEPMGQTFEFEESSGHVPVFDHVYKVSPVTHVFPEAILGVPFWPEVVAILPHAVSYTHLTLPTICSV